MSPSQKYNKKSGSNYTTALPCNNLQQLLSGVVIPPSMFKNLGTHNGAWFMSATDPTRPYLLLLLPPTEE